jgi:hypothetical protein
MWNNYTVEMQNTGRLEDHLAEARANALEAEARGPHASLVVMASRRASAVALRASRMRRSGAERAAALRLAATTRIRATRRQVAVAAGHLRHPHLRRPAFGHHRA